MPTFFILVMRVERTTSSFGGKHSIQLSYTSKCNKDSKKTKLVDDHNSFTINSWGSASTTSASRNDPTSASPSITFTISSFSMELPSVRP